MADPYLPSSFLSSSSMSDVYRPAAQPTAGLAAPTAPQQMQDFSGAPPVPPPNFDRPVVSTYYSPTRRQFLVGGYAFSEDDDAAAVESLNYVDRPVKPEGGDWQPVAKDSYLGYVSRITDPSMGRLISKNFGIGVDNLQMLAGFGLQFLGADETGKAIAEAQVEDLRKAAPYQRSFTDVLDGEASVADWFVANLAQQGPNLVETAATAAAGFAAGSAAGPITGAGAAIAAFAGKEAFKKSVKAAANKYAANRAIQGTTRKQALANLTTEERKALRTAAGILGGATASFVNSYGMGVSDVYGEQLEAGVPDKGVAALYGIPYAIADVVPEYLLAARVFGGLGKTGFDLSEAASKKAKRLLRRAGEGVVVGGALEGSAEAGQEALLLLANPAVDWDSPEGTNRLINSFAAGAAIGGPLGGVSNVLSNTQETNLLKPEPTQEQLPALPAPEKLLALPAPEGYINPTPQAAPPQTIQLGAQPPVGLPPELSALPMEPRPSPALEQQRTLNTLLTEPSPSALSAPTAGVLTPEQQARIQQLQQASLAQRPLAPLGTQVPPVGAPTIRDFQAPPQTPQEVAQSLAQAAQQDVARQQIAQLQGQARLQRGTQVPPLPPPPPVFENIPVVPTQPAPAEAAPTPAAPRELAPVEPTPAPAAPLDELRIEPTEVGRKTTTKYKLAEWFNSQPVETRQALLDERMQSLTQLRDEIKQSKKPAKIETDLKTRVEQLNAPKTGKKSGDNLRKRTLTPGGRQTSKTSGRDSLVKGRQKQAKAQEAVTEKAAAPTRVGKTEFAVGQANDRWLVYENNSPAAMVNGLNGFDNKTQAEAAARKESKRRKTAAAAEKVKKPKKTKPAAEAKTPTRPLEEPSKAEAEAAAAKQTEEAVAKAKAVAEAAQRDQAEQDRLAKEADERRATQDKADIQDLIDTYENESSSTTQKAKALEDLINLRRFNAAASQYVESLDLPAWVKTEIALNVNKGISALDASNTLARMIDTFNLEGATQVSPEFLEQAAEAWKSIPTKLRNQVMFGRDRLIDFINTKKEGAFESFNTVVDEEDGTLLIQPKTTGRMSINDWNTVTGTTNIDGTAIRGPMPILTLRAAVNKFVGRLKVKPSVTIYKNQADLKARNKALYDKAKAASPRDFDNVEAAAYTFDNDKIIIFSDRIANKQHLNFVLAHETIGHFGMRAIMPENKFASLMDELYEVGSQTMRNAIDIAVEMRGLSKREATEEYIADYAALLETNLVMKVLKAVQMFLRNLGIRYADDAVLLFIDQSKKYVRTGKTSSFFDANKIAKQLVSINNPTDEGRFSVANHALVPTMERLGSLRSAQYGLLGIKSPTEIWAYAQDQGFDTKAKLDAIKATFFSLSNYRALENPGLNAFDDLISTMRQRSMAIKTRINDELKDILNKQGMSAQEYKDLTDLVYNARALVASRYKPESDIGRKPLVVLDEETGVVREDPDEYNRLIEMGRISLKDAQQGYTLTFELAPGDVQTVKVPGIAGLTENSKLWKDYQRITKSMADLAVDRLKARLIDYEQDKTNAFDIVAELLPDGKLTPADKTFASQFISLYSKVYTANRTIDADGNVILDNKSTEAALEFAKFANQAVLADPKFLENDLTKLREHAVNNTTLTQTEMDKFVERLVAFRGRIVTTSENKFNLQNQVKNIVAKQLSQSQEESGVRRSIGTGYVPIIRTGGHEVRLQVLDKAGNALNVPEAYKERLVYSMFDSPSEARKFAELLTEQLKDVTFKVPASTFESTEYTEQEVKIVPTWGPAVVEATSDLDLNINEFLRGLTTFGISLPPSTYERIVRDMTKQNNLARSRMTASFTPGYDRGQMIMAISQHMERQASTIAKIETRGRLSNLMNLKLRASRNLWFGDPDAVVRAYKAHEAAKALGNDNSIRFTQRNLSKALYQFRKTNPSYTEWDGNPAKAPKAADLLANAQGKKYFNEAARTMAFINGNRNIDESDWGSTPFASGVRTYSSVIQLGGSIAQGVLNVISVLTNWLPYMMTMNAKTGFGGGFQFAAIRELITTSFQVGYGGFTTALTRKQMNNYNMAAFYDRLAAENDNPNHTTSLGIKVHEAKFLAREIRDGTFQPAQTLALVGTARGRKFNLDKVIDATMIAFNTSEQAARRSAGLASYRLQYNRAIEAGLSHEAAAENARKFAVDAVNLTLGDYAVLNRPAAWRSGFQSFLYMYKVYPTVVAHLTGNLSWTGKAIMLSSLVALAGVSGLPFAEDIEDLIDTLLQSEWGRGIAQGLGIQTGSIRAVIAKGVDSILPGASPAFFNGIVNEYFGSVADIAGKTSAGDFLPGTGLFLPGANALEEVKDIAGPAFAALAGTFTFATDLAALPFSTTVTAEKVLREAPVTALRMIGDAYAYTQSGAIVDRRGYVVSPEMTPWTVATRLLGFYPTAAANQYQLIKYAQRIGNFKNDVTSSFRQAWVSAVMRKDTARARQIVAAVNDWNRTTRGTALFIKDFTKNSQKALKQAQMSASQRALMAGGAGETRKRTEELFKLLVSD